MKHAGIFGLIVLFTLSCLGCACQFPGSGPCSPCGFGARGIGPGVVDYVDGGPCAGEASCGGCGTYATCGSACGCGYACGARCGNCLARVGSGVRVLGEGALDLVTAPLRLAGRVVTGGPCGYETYAGCGCSNEVYYGDNCFQPHDFCDPCGYTDGYTATCRSAASSGCTKCNSGYVEGIRYEGEPVIDSPVLDTNGVKSTPVMPRPVPNRNLRQQGAVFANPQSAQAKPAEQIVMVSAEERLTPPKKICASKNCQHGIPLR